MTAVQLNRRWVTAGSLLALIVLVYVVAYQGLGQDFVRNRYAPSRKDERYFAHRPQQAITPQRPTSADLGSAYYDYLEKPTTSVTVGLPKFLTRTTTSRRTEPTTTVKPYVKPTTAPQARPLPSISYTAGEVAHNSNFYTRKLVIFGGKKTNLDWLHDVRKQDPMLGTQLYVTDDKTAGNHLHHGETSVHLRYIIDEYDDLQDITLFLQAEKRDWRHDLGLNGSAPEVLQRLNYAKILRDGFANLRCTHDPGCAGEKTSGVQLSSTDGRMLSEESQRMLNIWKEFFGDQQPPANLSQPSFGQYAISKERIQSIPKAHYQYLYDRMAASVTQAKPMQTFWDAVWHFIWTGNEQYCPTEYDCYCELHGLCYKDDEEMLDQRKVAKHIEYFEEKLKKLGNVGDNKEKKKEQADFQEKLDTLRKYNNLRADQAAQRALEKFQPSTAAGQPAAAPTLRSRIQGVSDFFGSVEDKIEKSLGLHGG